MSTQKESRPDGESGRPEETSGRITAGVRNSFHDLCKPSASLSRIFGGHQPQDGEIVLRQEMGATARQWADDAGLPGAQIDRLIDYVARRGQRLGKCSVIVWRGRIGSEYLLLAISASGPESVMGYRTPFPWFLQQIEDRIVRAASPSPHPGAN